MCIKQLRPAHTNILHINQPMWPPHCCFIVRLLSCYVTTPHSSCSGRLKAEWKKLQCFFCFCFFLRRLFFTSSSAHTSTYSTVRFWVTTRLTHISPLSAHRWTCVQPHQHIHNNPPAENALKQLLSHMTRIISCFFIIVFALFALTSH